MVRTAGGSARPRASHWRWMAAAPNSPRSLASRNCWRTVSTRSSRWRSARLTGVGKPQGRSLQPTRSRRFGGGPGYPVLHSGQGHSELRRDFPRRAAAPNRLDHAAALLSGMGFLLMAESSQEGFLPC
jgi:hypothetical protein